MRKIMISILIVVFLLTACTTKNGNGQAYENSQIQKTDSSGESSATPEVSETETAESEQTAESSTTAAVESTAEQETVTGTGKEIEPLVSKKIDTSRQGVRMSSDMELVYTGMMRGDDGSCYYYRKEGKGKKKKIVFYKDNGTKVCETKMKKSFERGGYHIVSFAKYGKKFFVVLEEEEVVKTILTTVDIATGKWGKAIKDKYTYDNYIVYDNKFYCIDQGSAVTVYDLSDTKKKRKKLSPGGIVQCIVDDKIYYVAGEDTTKIMRCSLDGKKKEKIYEYGRDGWWMMGSLQIDENYIYYLIEIEDHEKYNLIRIPLYGGKIEGVAKAGGYFEIADDSVFVFDDDYIYRVNKDLVGKPKAVTKAYYYEYGIYSVEVAPFYYGGGHLLVPYYDWDELKYVDLMNEYDDDSWDIYIDGKTTYAPDWYRMSEDGTVEDTIKGTGVKKKWKKEYRKWN